MKATTPPAKKATKTAPTVASLQAAIKQRDGMLETMFASHSDLVARYNEDTGFLQSHIKAQEAIIFRYRGLTALAKGMGHI